MHPDGAIHFFDIKTKRQIVRVDIFVFMSLCLMFWQAVLYFLTKRQIVGVDIYVFMSLWLVS